VLEQNLPESLEKSALSNPNCPPNILMEIYERYKNEELSFKLADCLEHPLFPLEKKLQIAQESLSNNPSLRVLVFVRTTPGEILRVIYHRFKGNSNPWVNWVSSSCVSNQNFPVDLLNQILTPGREINEEIRSALENPNIPEHLKQYWEQMMEREKFDRQNQEDRK
jgi:hypothetical protein